MFKTIGVAVGILTMTCSHTMGQAGKKNRDGFVRIFDGKTLNN